MIRLLLVLLCALAPPASAQQALPVLARVGPWPVASNLIGYGNRLWLANSVKGINHNSADLYSYDPERGEVRYERHLFSQDAGRPLVAGGLLYWPFEDARSSLGVGQFMVTDGERWRFGTIPAAQTFHTHAMAGLGDDLIAATSAWRAGYQRSDDQGFSWRNIYDHPTPERRVSRIVRLATLGNLVFGALVSRDERGLLLLDDNHVEKVPGWPQGDPTIAITVFQGALYGLVREAKGVSVWQTDGRRSERLFGPREHWPAGDIAAGEDLWVVTADDGGGALLQSADGKAWDQRYRLEGGRPFDLAVHRGAVYVGGAGDDGRGILWGQRAASAATVEPARLPARPRIPARDWAAAGETLDRLLLDPATYAEGTGRLRDLVLELAGQDPPEDFFASRLMAALPSAELSLIGGNVRLDAAGYARWVLLWGMALAGEGHVPIALLEQPWTQRANRPEKYFSAPPAAMWAVSLIGQRDRATIDALIERLSRDDPLWLRGDAIGALCAVTGRCFGYDVAAWQDWWQAARPTLQE